MNRAHVLTRRDKAMLADGERQKGQVLPLVRDWIVALHAAQHHLVVLPTHRHDHLHHPYCQEDSAVA